MEIKMFRKLVVVVLSLSLLFSSFGLAFAATSKDTGGHWAEKQLTDWVTKGYIQGYADGQTIQ